MIKPNYISGWASTRRSNSDSLVSGWRRWTGIACLLLATQTSAIADTLTDNLFLLKAAYVFNFAKLTHYPENTWPQLASTFTLCTSGEDGLSNSLEQLEGRTIQGHPVTIINLKEGQDASICHLLYIATSTQQQYPALLQSVANRPILTVSERPYFAHNGGIIELYQSEGRSNFMINLRTARTSGLNISSRLLSLAKVIDKDPAL